MAKTSSSNTRQPIIMTITFASQGGSERSATLLIQRGDLASIRAFSYQNYNDVLAAMKAASNDLIALEIEPPDLTVKSSKKSSGNTLK